MADEITLKKVGFASFIMMASVFASRVIGMFREIAIAGTGGVQSSVDAYQVAFILPEILNHMVASGFLSITFIPIFSRYLSQNRPEEGFRIFSLILNTFGIILLCLIGLVMVRTPDLIRFFAPGIVAPETFTAAVKMTRIIIPAQFFFFTGGLLMAIQFANEKFFIPALAPLIYNLMIILGGLLLGPCMGMEGFAWGVLGGAFFGNFALQVWGARRLGVRYYPVFHPGHPDVIQYVRLTLPLMFGLTMTFSTEILLKYFGSYLSSGSIAAMNYALRVMFILVGLFGQAVGMASYPYMARLAEKDTLSELNELLNKTLKFILLVIPVSIFFMAASREVITVLFQRGQFDVDATAATAGVLPFFMAGAFAFSAVTIVSRGYYATQNTLRPTLISTLSVLMSLPVLFLLMRHGGARGVALGLSVSALLQSLVLYESWNRQSRNREKSGVYLFFFKMIFVGLIIGTLLHGSVLILRTIFNPSVFFGAYWILLISGIEFLCLFYLAGSVFQIAEIHILYNQLLKRIYPWKKK